MGKRLVIAEKPSVARDIAEALGGFDEKNEYLESDDYIVTWAVGHLLGLAEPKDYDKTLRSWSIKHLPIIPEEFRITPREGHKGRLDLIRKLGRRKDVDGLVNACDAGREGEMIFRRIVEYIDLDKPIERLWLQSMTTDAIREGFEQLRPGEELDSLGDAAWCRSVGDWLIGMNATRALTQRLKSRGEKGAWSAGRVQTPTLNLLVGREREILAHEPRPYWELFATFSHDDQTWEGRYWDPEAKKADDRDVTPYRIFDREVAERILKGVKARDTGVAEETRKRRKQNPPLPFDLTSLQREANRRFSFSAKRTLNAAQRLYEGHKLITYPRTDSRHLPGDYADTIRKTLGVLETDHEYGGLAARIGEQGPENLEKILDSSKVSDHFAIIPTAAGAGQLSPDDTRIYDMIVRQFLAMLMGPATWVKVERIVTVKLDDEAPRFRITARHLDEPGFLEALGKEKGSGTHLPALVAGKQKAEGVEVAVDEARDEAKQTTPPNRYSESQLLRMMETAGEYVEDEELSDVMRGRGIGTPATRADTIEGLVRKGYARRVDGRLGSTSKAMRLMDVIERVEVPTLASPKLTGEWEYALQQVQNGQLDRSEMFTRLTDYTRDVVEHLTGFDHEHLYDDMPSLGTCPECGEGEVVESAWGYPCSRNTGPKSGCNFIIWKDRAGRFVDRGLVRKLLEDRKVGPVTGFVDRYGRSLEGHLELARDPEKERWRLEVEFGQPLNVEDEEQQGVLCKNPVDEDDEIIETNLRYVSRKVLEGEKRRGPVLPKVVCHREIDPDEARLFFSEDGKTPYLEGFISKRGRPFKGALFRKKTGKHGFEFPPREKKKGKKKAKKKGGKGKAKSKTKTKSKGKAKSKAKKKGTKGSPPPQP